MKYFIMRHGSTSLNIKKKMQGRIDAIINKKEQKLCIINQV